MFKTVSSISDQDFKLKYFLGFTPWGQYSGCNVSCGIGTKIKTRQCVEGTCLVAQPSDLVESQSCNQKSCKSSILRIIHLTLIREFLRPSPSTFSGKKKSRIVAGDITVRTMKMKFISVDRVSVRLSYDANIKWHMPI